MMSSQQLVGSLLTPSHRSPPMRPPGSLLLQALPGQALGRRSHALFTSKSVPCPLLPLAAPPSLHTKPTHTEGTLQKLSAHPCVTKEDQA